MATFHEMLQKITSSSDFDHMMRFVAPLKDHLGINHFWYYKLSFSGDYSYIGTHTAWSEFCFDKAMVNHFPCLRHPCKAQHEINFMKVDVDEEYKKVLEIAWEKFHINFSLNLINNTTTGVEAFGFATHFNDPWADQRLLNHLPLLRYFIKAFTAKHAKLLQLLDDNQVNLPTHFGGKYYERPKMLAVPDERDIFLRKMGFETFFSLTKRERDVLKLISNGYPASYIAKVLKLGSRTVENYIATIKGKLSCNSKVELIQKAQEMISLCHFEETPKEP